MSEENLGRVQGAGFFFSTAVSSTSADMATLSPSTIKPVYGDNIIFANGDIRNITAVSDTAVTCGGVVANLQGADGLSIWETTTNTTTGTTSIAISTLNTVEGRSVQVGDYIIGNATYSYLYLVTAVNSTTVTVTYRRTLRGATGATVTVDSALSDVSVNPVQNNVINAALEGLKDFIGTPDEIITYLVENVPSPTEIAEVISAAKKCVMRSPRYLEGDTDAYNFENVIYYKDYLSESYGSCVPIVLDFGVHPFSGDSATISNAVENGESRVIFERPFAKQCIFYDGDGWAYSPMTNKIRLYGGSVSLVQAIDLHGAYSIFSTLWNTATVNNGGFFGINLHYLTEWAANSDTPRKRFVNNLIFAMGGYGAGGNGATTPVTVRVFCVENADVNSNQIPIFQCSGSILWSGTKAQGGLQPTVIIPPESTVALSNVLNDYAMGNAYGAMQTILNTQNVYVEIDLGDIWLPIQIYNE